MKTSLAPGSQVVTEYLDKAGLQKDRSTSSASIWSASAAPPASAIPGRCRRRIPRRSTTAIWWPPRCFRATAISKAASMPTCGPTISPRRRWSWPMPSPASMYVDLAKDPLGVDQEGKNRCSSRTSGRRTRKSANTCAKNITKQIFAKTIRRCFQGRRQLAQDRGPRRADLQVGRSLDLRTEPALLRRPDAQASAADRRHHRRARARAIRQFDHHRSHLAGGLDQGSKPPPANICATIRSARRISTNTAHGAAITRS